MHTMYSSMSSMQSVSICLHRQHRPLLELNPVTKSVQIELHYKTDIKSMLMLFFTYNQQIRNALLFLFLF